MQAKHAFYDKIDVKKIVIFTLQTRNNLNRWL